MYSMLRAAVTAILCTYALAAKYCCYPSQWESLNIFLHGARINGTAVYSNGEEMLSVDAVAEMANSMASITTSSVTTAVRTIQDFKGGKQYQIIGDTCKVTALGPYTNRCVPDDARLVVPNNIFGLGANQLAYSVYSLDQGDKQIYLDIAKPDCTPLAVTTSGQLYGLASKFYSNITLGIKDRSVFNIPSICQKGTTHIHHQQAHPVYVHGIA